MLKNPFTWVGLMGLFIVCTAALSPNFSPSGGVLTFALLAALFGVPCGALFEDGTQFRTNATSRHLEFEIESYRAKFPDLGDLELTILAQKDYYSSPAWMNGPGILIVFAAVGVTLCYGELSSSKLMSVVAQFIIAWGVIVALGKAIYFMSEVRQCRRSVMNEIKDRGLLDRCSPPQAQAGNSEV